MTDLGVETLREIRARVDAATPGPWYVTGDLDWSDVDDESAVGVARGDHQADDDSYAMLLVTPGSGSFEVAAEAFKRRVENAEFAAHARQDVPALLDLVGDLASRPTVVHLGPDPTQAATPEQRETDARRDLRRAVILRVIWQGRRRLSGGASVDEVIRPAFENIAREVEKALGEVRL